MVEALMSRGLPWFKYREKIAEATQDFGFSVKFGWTPEQLEDIDENYPEKKQEYLALMRGETIANSN